MRRVGPTPLSPDAPTSPVTRSTVRSAPPALPTTSLSPTIPRAVGVITTGGWVRSTPSSQISKVPS